MYVRKNIRYLLSKEQGSIDYEGQGLSSLGFTAIVKGMNSFDDVSKINLSSNDLGTLGGISFTQSLGIWTSFTKALIYQHKLTFTIHL